jgi:hypothetical protein
MQMLGLVAVDAIVKNRDYANGDDREHAQRDSQPLSDR